MDIVVLIATVAGDDVQFYTLKEVGKLRVFWRYRLSEGGQGSSGKATLCQELFFALGPRPLSNPNMGGYGSSHTTFALIARKIIQFAFQSR